MREASQNYVLRFIDTTDASMSGMSRRLPSQSVCLWRRYQPGFSLSDSYSDAKKKGQERGLRRAAGGRSRHSLNHADLCFSLADTAKALSLGVNMRRLSEADNVAASFGRWPQATPRCLRSTTTYPTLEPALLDEATDELDAEDDAGLTFGSSFEEEKRGFKGRFCTGATAPPVIARGGTPLAFGCSCNGCKAPDNKSCTDECVEEAPGSEGVDQDGRRAGKLSGQSVQRAFRRARQHARGHGQHARRAWRNTGENGSAMRKPMPSPDGSSTSPEPHDVATFDAVAQARAYAKLKRENATVSDGHHPVCLVKMIPTMARMGLNPN